MPDAEASYNLALDYLYSFVDYSLKHSSELARADFNLDRMRLLMAELGDPQLRYPILHVAGTKGKGSVCALAASGLQAAGYRVGLYTSPHLLDYCERIQIDGRPVSHDQLVSLVEFAKPAVARIPKLTTFEITTALGLLYFADQKVDVAVIEVGLGGRLDATNVVMPRTSVITSLSYDHMAVLGDTLAKIAAEKAGIIKDHIPVVSAPQKQEALEVLVRIARERNAALHFGGAGRHLQTAWPFLGRAVVAGGREGSGADNDNSAARRAPGPERGHRGHRPLGLARRWTRDSRLGHSIRIWQGGVAGPFSGRSSRAAGDLGFGPQPGLLRSASPGPR